MSDHHPDWEAGYAFTLTVTEAATVLRISRSTAYALVASGAVPSIKLGRRIVVPVRPLAEMLGLALYDLQFALGKVRGPCLADLPSASAHGVRREARLTRCGLQTIVINPQVALR